MKRLRSGLLESRSVVKAIGLERTAIVLAVALTSATAVLLFERLLGSMKWEWGQFVSSVVGLAATAIVIFGLLERSRQRRWEEAEGADLASLSQAAQLAAHGWARSSGSKPPRAGRGELADPVEEQIETLRSWQQKLEDAAASLRLEGTGADLEVHEAMQLATPKPINLLTQYSVALLRKRRLDSLFRLVQLHLPAVLERRDDPELFRHYIALRETGSAAMLATQHTDGVIVDTVFLDPPPGLSGFLDRGGLNAYSPDPVFALARAMAFAWDRRCAELHPAQSPPVKLDWRRELGFAVPSLEALCRELAQVADALVALQDLTTYAEAGLTAPTSSLSWWGTTSESSAA